MYICVSDPSAPEAIHTHHPPTHPPTLPIVSLRRNSRDSHAKGSSGVDPSRRPCESGNDIEWAPSFSRARGTHAGRCNLGARMCRPPRASRIGSETLIPRTHQARGHQRRQRELLLRGDAGANRAGQHQCVAAEDLLDGTAQPSGRLRHDGQSLRDQSVRITLTSAKRGVPLPRPER